MKRQVDKNIALSLDIWMITCIRFDPVMRNRVDSSEGGRKHFRITLTYLRTIFRHTVTLLDIKKKIFKRI